MGLGQGELENRVLLHGLHAGNQEILQAEAAHDLLRVREAPENEERQYGKMAEVGFTGSTDGGTRRLVN